jgi:hypothetical protein
MTSETFGGDPLPVYTILARNTSADSENRIHDDAVAAEYGFQGGLVPGLAVYSYMTVPIVERYHRQWLERGSMQVKFHRPFYEGDEVIIRALADEESDPVKVAVRAERGDGTVCATGLATVNDSSSWLGELRAEDYPEAPLPPPDRRPAASREMMAANTVLGSLRERVKNEESALFRGLDERLPIYSGAQAAAHPGVLLGLANQILMRNYELPPWIHTASDLINRSCARDGEEISVRGRVIDCFERKGREFVVLNLLLLADAERIVCQVRHTAIYKVRRQM